MPKNDTLPKARFKCRANPTATFLTEKTCIARKKKPNNENSLLLDMCKGCPGPLDIDAEVDMKSNIDRLKERKKFVDKILDTTIAKPATTKPVPVKESGGKSTPKPAIKKTRNFSVLNQTIENCKDCGKVLSRQCKTGFCHKCARKYVINLNLSSFPEVFKGIERRAKEDDRTVYLEVLHFLKKEFGG